MKNKIPAVLIIILMGTLACNTVTNLLPGAATPTPAIPDGYYEMTDTCRRAVDGIKEIQAGLDFPDFYNDYESLDVDISSWVERIDVNEYFQYLDHLSIEEGYYFSHMYYYDWMGGGPLLYAEELGKGPYYRIEDYEEYYGVGMEEDVDWEEMNNSYDFRPHTILDDSPESYFQYHVLSLLGNQFDLFWHSNYNDTVILCDQSDLDAVQESLYEFDIEFANSIREQIPDLDYTPYVIVNDDTVEVRFLTFTKWGGFYEETYIMSRDLPVEIFDFDFNNLIEYDCGIMF